MDSVIDLDDNSNLRSDHIDYSTDNGEGAPGSPESEGEKHLTEVI